MRKKNSSFIDFAYIVFYTHTSYCRHRFNPSHLARLSETRGEAIVIGERVGKDGAKMRPMLDLRPLFPLLPPRFIAHDLRSGMACDWNEYEVIGGVRIETAVQLPKKPPPEGVGDWKELLLLESSREAMAQWLQADLSVYALVKYAMWANPKTKGRRKPCIWELFFTECGSEAAAELRKQGKSASLMITCEGKSDFVAFLMPDVSLLKAYFDPPAATSAASTRSSSSGPAKRLMTRAAAWRAATRKRGKKSCDNYVDCPSEDSDSEMATDQLEIRLMQQCLPKKVIGSRRRRLWCCETPNCDFCTITIPELAKERHLPCLLDPPLPGAETAKLFDMMRPDHSGLSLIQRIKLLGLDTVFSALCDKIQKARLFSMSAFDVESLTTYFRKPRFTNISTVRADAVLTGQSTVGKQVPFLIGVSYVEPGQGILESDIKRRAFVVRTESGIPTNADIQLMVDEFLDFVFDLKERSMRVKLQSFQSELDMLREIEKEHDKYATAARFKTTYFGALLKQLEKEIRCFFLAGHGAHHYDVVILAKYLYRYSTERQLHLSVIKNGGRFKIMVMDDLNFIDTMNLWNGVCSLEKSARCMGITEIKKTFMPHAFFTSMTVVRDGNSMPLYDESYFSKLNNPQVKLCTREEYDAFIARLREPGVTPLTIYLEYVQDDAALCLLVLRRMRSGVMDLFGTDLLDSPNVGATSFFYQNVTGYLPFAHQQPGFERVVPSLLLAILENCISGGYTARSVEWAKAGEPMGVGLEPAACIHLLDYCGLYSSTLRKNNVLPFGVSAVYSCQDSFGRNILQRGDRDCKNENDDTAKNFLFKRSSQGRTFTSENWTACVLFQAERQLEKLSEGYEVTSCHHEGLGGEMTCVDNCRPDCVVAMRRPIDGKTKLYLFFYDGYYSHFKDSNDVIVVHQKECWLYDGSNGFDTSANCQETLALTERYVNLLRSTLALLYDEVIVVRRSFCMFHNTYEFDGFEYASPAAALNVISMRFPELQIPRDFDYSFTLSELEKRLFCNHNRDSYIYDAGFVVCSGYVPKEERDPYFGLCVGKKKIDRKELLTPAFTEMLTERLSAEMPHLSLEDATNAYLDEVTSTRKLLASHSFERATISLSYYAFLRKVVNFKVTRCFHIVLFSLRRKASVDCHVFPKFVSDLQLRRERYNRLRDLEPEGSENYRRYVMFGQQLKVSTAHRGWG